MNNLLQLLQCGIHDELLMGDNTRRDKAMANSRENQPQV